jgi:hypothetical protein
MARLDNPSAKLHCSAHDCLVGKEQSSLALREALLQGARGQAHLIYATV